MRNFANMQTTLNSEGGNFYDGGDTKFSTTSRRKYGEGSDTTQIWNKLRVSENKRQWMISQGVDVDMNGNIKLPTGTELGVQYLNLTNGDTTAGKNKDMSITWKGRDYSFQGVGEKGARLVNGSLFAELAMENLDQVGYIDNIIELILASSDNAVKHMVGNQAFKAFSKNAGTEFTDAIKSAGDDMKLSLNNIYKDINCLPSFLNNVPVSSSAYSFGIGKLRTILTFGCPMILDNYSGLNFGASNRGDTSNIETNKQKGKIPFEEDKKNY